MLRMIDLAPDWVLHNGNLITVDPQQLRASAVAIKDGRFVAVGDDAEILPLAGSRTQLVNLEGKSVTPGIIDAHNHLYRTGRSIGVVRLYDCRSIVQIQAKIVAYAETVPVGSWIWATGWNESLLKEQRFPTRWDIDAVCPDYPVVLDRTWNKLTCNSLALKLIGVDRDTPYPPEGLRYAGQIIKDETGEITGVLTDRAKTLLYRKMPIFTDEYIERCITASCTAYNKVGLTSIVDPGLRPEEIRGFQRARANGGLTVRASLCVGAWGHTSIWSPEEEAALFDKVHHIGVYSGFGDHWLRLDCVKIMPDGGGSDGTALMYEPFASRPDFTGEATVDPDRIADYVWYCHQRGWSMDAHCCGDRMQDIVAEAFAAAYKRMPSARIRHRIHHAYLPTQKSLSLMAEHKIAAVTQPVFLWSQGESMIHHFGRERANRLMPARTYLNAGIPVAFTSDTGVADYNPWLGMFSAMTRVSLNGNAFDPSERVTREEALKGYTIDAAWMTFEEQLKGSITPGKLADLVVIDRDYMTVPVDEIRQIQVLGTMIDGKWVYRRDCQEEVPHSV